MPRQGTRRGAPARARDPRGGRATAVPPSAGRRGTSACWPIGLRRAPRADGSTASGSSAATSACPPGVHRDPGNWRLWYGLARMQAMAGRDPRGAAREARRLNPLNRSLVTPSGASAPSSVPRSGASPRRGWRSSCRRCDRGAGSAPVSRRRRTRRAPGGLHDLAGDPQPDPRGRQLTRARGGDGRPTGRSAVDSGRALSRDRARS